MAEEARCRRVKNDLLVEAFLILNVYFLDISRKRRALGSPQKEDMRGDKHTKLRKLSNSFAF